MKLPLFSLVIAALACLTRVNADVTLPKGLPTPPPSQPAAPGVIPPVPQAPPPPQIPPVMEVPPGGPAAPAVMPVFETPGPFAAREILQLPYLSSPNHTVRDGVTTNGGVNHYVIDSPFGVFIADGNQMLADRVDELAALAKLKTMTQSPEFVEALRRAASSPVTAAAAYEENPQDSLAAVPKGIAKFFKRVGSDIKSAAKGEEPSAVGDSGMKQAHGLSATKRSLCQQLGVNPYSSNAVLQHEIDQVAWAMFAGNYAVTTPIGGAPGPINPAASPIDASTLAVYAQSPAELRERNEEKLDDEMEIDDDIVDTFLANTHFTPWHQTRIVASLESLPGVHGRGIFLRDAAVHCENETDATFYEQTARLIAHVNTYGPKIKRILLVNNLPVCETVDGQILLALEWDYAAWTPQADRTTTLLQGMTIEGARPTGYILAITGAVSPRLRQEIEARGVRVNDRLLKGPIN